LARDLTDSTTPASMPLASAKTNTSLPSANYPTPIPSHRIISYGTKTTERSQSLSSQGNYDWEHWFTNALNHNFLERREIAFTLSKMLYPQTSLRPLCGSLQLEYDNAWLREARSKTKTIYFIINNNENLRKICRLHSKVQQHWTARHHADAERNSSADTCNILLRKHKAGAQQPWSLCLCRAPFLLKTSITRSRRKQNSNASGWSVYSIFFF
jgi:hypothetical protein